MIFNVCTSSTFDQLCTVQDVKDLIGVTGTSDDTLISLFVSASTNAIEKWARRIFRKQTYTEDVAGFGDLRITMKQYPIQSITSITNVVDDTVVDSTSYEIQEPDLPFIYRREGWPWTAGVEWELIPNPKPGQEAHDFEVEYVAGYTGPGSSATDELPSAIRIATAKNSMHLYLTRDEDLTVASKKVGDLSINYKSEGADDISPIAKSLLANYRRLF